MIINCNFTSDTLNNGNIVEDLKYIATTLIAIGAYILAYRQYSDTQKWKKSEFAAKEDQKIFTNHKLRHAIRFLDWSTFTFEIPDEYKVLAEEEMGRQYNKLFTHNWDKVAIAMKSKEDRKGKDYEWFEMMYREYFAELFDHFGEILHYLGIPLCTPDDLHHTKYYLGKINERISNHDVLNRNNIDVTKKHYGIFHDFWRRFYPEGKIHELYKTLAHEDFNKHVFNGYE